MKKTLLLISRQLRKKFIYVTLMKLPIWRYWSAMNMEHTARRLHYHLFCVPQLIPICWYWRWNITNYAMAARKIIRRYKTGMVIIYLAARTYERIKVSRNFHENSGLSAFHAKQFQIFITNKGVPCLYIVTNLHVEPLMDMLPDRITWSGIGSSRYKKIIHYFLCQFADLWFMANTWDWAGRLHASKPMTNDVQTIAWIVLPITPGDIAE